MLFYDSKHLQANFTAAFLQQPTDNSCLFSKIAWQYIAGSKSNINTHGINVNDKYNFFARYMVSAFFFFAPLFNCISTFVGY